MDFDGTDDMDMPGWCVRRTGGGGEAVGGAGKNAGRGRQKCSESAPARSMATRPGVGDGGGDPGPRRTSCGSESAFSPAARLRTSVTFATIPCRSWHAAQTHGTHGHFAKNGCRPVGRSAGATRAGGAEEWLQGGDFSIFFKKVPSSPCVWLQPLPRLELRRTASRAPPVHPVRFSSPSVLLNCPRSCCSDGGLHLLLRQCRFDLYVRLP